MRKDKTMKRYKGKKKKFKFDMKQEKDPMQRNREQCNIVRP